MYTQEAVYTQMTFHYMNGQSESFNLYAPIESDGSNQTLQLEVRHLLKKDWWIINLPDQTVFVNIDNVVKVEVKPAVEQLKGEDVFTNAERVTALNRSR
jgi:pantothenate kinase